MQRVGGLVVVVDDDELPLRDGPAAGALAYLDRSVQRSSRLQTCGTDDHGLRRLLGVDAPEHDHALAEQFGGTSHDGLEHVGYRCPNGDRALDARQACQQRLSLFQRGQRRLLAARHGERPAHPPRQVALSEGERAAGAREQEPTVRALERHGQHVTASQTG